MADMGTDRAEDKVRAEMFRARGLTKVYRMGEVEVHALRGIDLVLYPGEFVVILGPSGCGKSTLLNILGGLDVPTEGEVWYNGHDLTHADDAVLTRFRRDNVGFVFQFYNLIPSLTARENVAIVTEIARQPMPPEEALALVGLTALTVITRCLFFISARPLPMPRWLERGLQYAPIAALAAVVAPDVLALQMQDFFQWRDARLWAALAAALFEVDVFGGKAGDELHGFHHFGQPGFVFGMLHDPAGVVFLQVDVVAVDVDGEGVLRYVAVVEPPGFYVLPARPFDEVFGVFAQPVGKGGDFAHVRLPEKWKRSAAILRLIAPSLQTGNFGFQVAFSVDRCQSKDFA